MDNTSTTITRSKTIPLGNTYLDVQITLEIKESLKNPFRKYRLLIREHELRTQLAKATLVNAEIEVTEYSTPTLKDEVEEIDTKILSIAKGKIFDAIDFLLRLVTKAEDTLKQGGKGDT